MSNNIKERRMGSASVPEKNRAAIVNSDAKQKRSVGRAILIALVIVVLLVAAALVAVNMLIDNLTGSIATDGDYKLVEIEKGALDTDYIAENKIFSAEVQGNDTFKNYALLASQNHSSVVNAIVDDENVFNYAIYGIDSTTNDVDVIIIASVNKATKSIKYVLLDDKMLVSIPYADQVGCLEAAYGIGGANLLSRTIAQNFGVDIDGYIALDMENIATLASDPNTKIEVFMTVDEIKALNKSIAAFNKRFEGLEGFEALNDDLPAEADRMVELKGYYVLAYVRGANGLNNKAVFNLFVEATKKALSNGVSGVQEFTELLKGNSRISTSADDFSSVLQLVALSATELNASVNAENFVYVLSADKLLTKNVRIKNAEGKTELVSFVVVEDYSAMVTELYNLLYK